MMLTRFMITRREPKRRRLDPSLPAQAVASFFPIVNEIEITEMEEDAPSSLELLVPLLRSQILRPVENAPATFDQVPDDVLPNIFGFLSSAKDFLSLAMCSKYLYKFTAKPQIVVGFAYFQGEKARRCVNFNSEDNTAEKRHEKFILPYVDGIAICHSCASATTTLNRASRSWFIEHTKSNRLFDAPQTEVFTNIPVGPLICAPTIRHIESRVLYSVARKQALKNEFHQARAARSEDDRLLRENILAAIQDARKDYNTFRRKKEELWLKKVQESVSKRRMRVQNVFDEIKSRLGDYGFKELALAPTVQEYLIRRFVSMNEVREYRIRRFVFMNEIAREELQRLVDAPSKASKKKIKEAVAKVRDRLNASVRDQAALLENSQGEE